MIYEILVGAALYILVGLFGLPVVLMFARSRNFRNTRFNQSLILLAPAFGLAVITLLVALLYIYFGATRNWAYWVAAVGIGLNAALLVIRRLKGGRFDWKLARPAGGVISAMLAAAAFAAPAVVSGPDGVVVRSNPSDAFLYITLAENTRVASRSVLREGSAQSTQALMASEADEIVIEIDDSVVAEELLSRNPLALYSARFIDRLRLGTYVLLGWFAHIAQLPVSHVLWVFCGLTSAAAASAAFGFLKELRIPPWLGVVGAVAAVTGYWHFVAADRENFSTLHVLPLIIAVAFVWAAARGRVTWRGPLSGVLDSAAARSVLVLALLLAACFVAYIELFPFVIFALLISVVIASVKRERGHADRAGVLVGAVTVSVCALILARQFFQNIDVFVAQMRLALAAQSSIGEFPSSEYLEQNVMTAIAGLAWVDTALRPFGIDWKVAGALEWLAGFLVCALVALLAPLTLFERCRAVRFPFAVMAGGVVVALYGVYLDDPYYALKGMPIAAPLAAVLLAAWSSSVIAIAKRVSGGGLASRLIPVLHAPAVVALLVIAAFGASASIRAVHGENPNHVQAAKAGQDFDLGPIVDEIRRRPNCRLQVSLDMIEYPWWWRAYVIEQTARFDPIVVGGYLLDNKPRIAIFEDVAVAENGVDLVLVEANGSYGDVDSELIIEHAGLRLMKAPGQQGCDAR